MIVAIILLAILAVIALLLFSPIRIRIRASRDRVRCKATYLFIPIPLFKLIRRRARRKNTRKNKADPLKRSSSDGGKAGGFGRQYRLARRLIAAILVRFPHLLRMRIKRLWITVGTDDPARTAVVYGGVAASLAFLLEWADRRVATVKPVRNGALLVRADFLSPGMHLEADIVFSTHLLSVILFLIRILLSLPKKRASRIAKKSKCAVSA